MWSEMSKTLWTALPAFAAKTDWCQEPEINLSDLFGIYRWICSINQPPSTQRELADADSSWSPVVKWLRRWLLNGPGGRHGVVLRYVWACLIVTTPQLGLWFPQHQPQLPSSANTTPLQAVRDSEAAATWHQNSLSASKNNKQNNDKQNSLWRSCGLYFFPPNWLFLSTDISRASINKRC